MVLDRPISPEGMTEILKEAAPEIRWKWYVENLDMDYAYEIPGVARFRVNTCTIILNRCRDARHPTKIMTIDSTCRSPA